MLYNVIILELFTFFHHDHVIVWHVTSVTLVCDSCDSDIMLNPDPQ